jgi:hypothetical protein
MSKEIKLTQGQVAIVDDEDYEYLNKVKWYAQWAVGTKSYYAMRRKGLTCELMHRAIMNNPSGLLVDHINHETLDNRKDNLRIVTSSQNSLNRKIMSTNKSSVTGVVSRRGIFEVAIGENGKIKHIGTFKTLEAAAAAYKAEYDKRF